MSLRGVQWLAPLAGLTLCLAGSARADAPKTEPPKADSKPDTKPEAVADPDKESVVRYNAGVKAFEDGDFPAAIEDLQASVRFKPTAKAYFQLGNAFAKVGQLDDAKSAFERFLSLEPKSSKRKKIEELVKQLGVLATTRLDITSFPQGATVYIDLKAEGSRGKTPLKLPVEPGRHRVILELDGYDNAQVTEAIAVEGKDVPVSATLKAKGCDIALDATPSSAVARIDGTAPVALPSQVRVSIGAHVVEFSGAGLITSKKSVSCVDYKPLALHEALSEAPTGLVTVRAPAGAAIKLDGKPADAAIATGLKVSPGEHQVDVVAAGKAPWHLTTKVSAGEDLDLTPRLDVGGTGGGGGVTGVVVSPEPAGSVYLDGAEIPSGVIASAKAGEHNISVYAPGYKAYKRSIGLAAGESAHLEPHLERRGHAALGFGVLMLVLAAGAEGVAIYGRLQAGNQVAGSSGFNYWHNYELYGQVAAGGLAVVGLGSILVWAALGKSESPRDEKPRVALTPLTGGGALSVSGRF